jgi:type VI secretion system protein VasD
VTIAPCIGPFVVAATLAAAAGIGEGEPQVHSRAIPALAVSAQQTPPGAGDAKTRVPLTIATSKDVNPDSEGRPSPVVLRVYQLKGDAAFSRADYFALLDDDQRALGGELVSRDEFVLIPAESRNLEIAISPDARFVAATAGFRDIRNAEWRVLVQAPIKGLTVAVERARVRVFPD